jgi:hypothetical protein
MASHEHTHRRKTVDAHVAHLCTNLHKGSQEKKIYQAQDHTHTEKPDMTHTLSFQHSSLTCQSATPLPGYPPSRRGPTPCSLVSSPLRRRRDPEAPHLIPHRPSEVVRPLRPSPASPPPSEVPAPPHRPPHRPSEVWRLLTCLPPPGEVLSPLPCVPPAMVRSCNPSPTPPYLVKLPV